MTDRNFCWTSQCMNQPASNLTFLICSQDIWRFYIFIGLLSSHSRHIMGTIFLKRVCKRLQSAKLRPKVTCVWYYSRLSSYEKPFLLASQTNIFIYSCLRCHRGLQSPPVRFPPWRHSQHTRHPQSDQWIEFQSPARPSLPRPSSLMLSRVRCPTMCFLPTC